MMSSSLLGIQAVPVIIETDVSFGMGQFTIVGLPDTSVKEARDRIRAAIKNTGFQFPRGRITVNLAPADLRKQGPIYDLPIALSILAAHGEIPIQHLEQSVVLGELALDGSVRPVRGSLASSLMARRLKKTSLLLPKENAGEASIIQEVTVFGVSSLREVIDHLLGIHLLEQTHSHETSISDTYNDCFSMIRGQNLGKRGLEIAAAGGHNVLLSGPPGTGKTLLAKTFPSILPPLTQEEGIEVTSIASVAGILDRPDGLIFTRPFRSPHHSSSAISLVGGGSWPIPGEISLAHRGVLFLDELPEFPRHVIEHLRQPLEDGTVTISRAQACVKFPAQFQLIASMNPCPCGYATDPKRTCTCRLSQKEHYQKRISGPLLDRIDLRIEISNLSSTELLAETRFETSAYIKTRVIAARQKQLERFLGTSIRLNAEISAQKIDAWCALNTETKTLLSFAMEKQSLSARACMRIRKVARTIADLSGSDTIEEIHMAEALQFRGQPQHLVHPHT